MKNLKVFKKAKYSSHFIMKANTIFPIFFYYYYLMQISLSVQNDFIFIQSILSFHNINTVDKEVNYEKLLLAEILFKKKIKNFTRF